MSDTEATEATEQHGATEVRSTHGEETLARATAAGVAGRVLTTKELAKIQADGIQDLCFRELFRCQRPASRGGRTLNRLRVISVIFVPPCFSVTSVSSVH